MLLCHIFFRIKRAQKVSKIVKFKTGVQNIIKAKDENVCETCVDVLLGHLKLYHVIKLRRGEHLLSSLHRSTHLKSVNNTLLIEKKVTQGFFLTSNKYKHLSSKLIYLITITGILRGDQDYCQLNDEGEDECREDEEADIHCLPLTGGLGQHLSDAEGLCARYKDCGQHRQ